jgi:hypothetical protein
MKRIYTYLSVKCNIHVHVEINFKHLNTGILNSLYDMGDLELLNSVVDISHWVETPISLHAAAKQASFSLSCKRCKYKGNWNAFTHIYQSSATYMYMWKSILNI